MNNTVEMLNVHFYGKTYEIPSDVITFLKCREYVSNGLVKLIDEASSLMSKYNRLGAKKGFEDLPEDVRHIQQIMMSIVKGVHNDLLKRKIFDVDEYDLYEKVTSIKKVEEETGKLMEGVYSEVLEIQRSNQISRNYAYNSAARNITGSGVGIFTNSFASFITYSAIENSILKSQAKKADQEYAQALKEISKSSQDKFTQVFANMLYNGFLPMLTDIFTLFHNELFQNYLLELVQHNQLDTDKMQGYSENKSCTMIENIKHADDKKQLLIEAFEICPFNFDIYTKIVELGYFDVDTMKDAKKIFPVKDLIALLENKVKRNLNDIEKKKDYIEVLAYYKGKNEVDILKSFYASTISKIKNDYHEIFLVCIDSRRLSTWIKDHISKDRDKIASTSEDTIKDNVNKWIKNTVDDKQYEELSVMGLISIDDIKYKDSIKTTLEDVQMEYADKMIALILDYIKKLGEKKAAYEEAYDKYNAGLKIHTDAISAKNEELKQQGLFAFSKKKELKSELERLNRDYEEYRKTEPIDLKNAYFNM